VAISQSLSAQAAWAPAGFFPWVDNEGIWRTKVPSGVQGQIPVRGLGAKSWQHFLKIMHKYFVFRL